MKFFCADMFAKTKHQDKNFITVMSLLC